MAKNSHSGHREYVPEGMFGDNHKFSKEDRLRWSSHHVTILKEGDWVSLSFKSTQYSNPNTEGWEILYKSPYLIFLGDWNPLAIFKINTKSIEELRHAPPAYFRSKCVTSDQPSDIYWIVLQSVFEDLYNQAKKMVGIKDESIPK
jgi:hypothetical protein